MNRSAPIRRILIILAWLVIWQLVSWGLGNPFLFCGPLEACEALVEGLPTPAFWTTIGWSLLRITIGFAIAFIAGICLGALGARLSWLDDWLSPLINVIKSTPVVCFIALLLVWFGSAATTSIIVGLVVFPPFYFAMGEIHHARNWRIEEMLVVFHISRWRRFLCARWPMAASYLRAAAKSAVGMAWKAGVAAELIGLPLNSIGDAIYRSKLSLHTDSIIAWTAMVIFISWLAERVLVWLIKASTEIPARVLDADVARAQALDNAPESSLRTAAASLSIRELHKTYGDHAVFEDLTGAFEAGSRVCLMAASGAGKTTLLRLMAGLEEFETGSLDLTPQDGLSVMFQETRLVDALTVSENLALTATDDTELHTALRFVGELFPNEAATLSKHATELSGGMQRRVELARTLAHPSSIVLLDEPFAGLDEDTKGQAIELIDRTLDGRTLIVATHDPQDAELLDAAILRL